MALKIIWSSLAEKNLEEILAYWSKRNGSNSYSRKLASLIFQSAELLSNYPLLGKSSNLKKIRFKIVRNYYLIYEICQEEIHIHAIWDQKLNPIKLKKFLKTLS